MSLNNLPLTARGGDDPTRVSAEMDPRTALLGADPAILAAIYVHLTARTDWLHACHRGMYDAYRDGRPLPDPAELSALVDDVLVAMSAFASGIERPNLPPTEVIEEILAVVAGERLGAAYVQRAIDDLWAEQMRHCPPLPPPHRTKPSIVVIGAGLAGLAMAKRLRDGGFEFTVLERNAEIGGVWLDNIYPDCGLDTHPNLYALSNESYDGWCSYDPKRDEVLAYARSYAERNQLMEHIRFGVEVRAITFDSTEQSWTIDLTCESGQNTLTTDAVVSAVGTLNQPKLPDIDGLSTFIGQAFHTAQWPAGIDLRGKRVGIVGNGSSGVQVARPVAEECESLTVFQRSPAWIIPRPATFGPIGAGDAWLMREVPFYATWQRIGLYWTSGDREFDTLMVDPDWTGGGISERNEGLRADLTEYIVDQLPGRPDLVERLTPHYPPFAKRVVVDNRWYETMARPHVELVTENIVRVTPTGLVTTDGQHHELDVIIFATGFHGTRFLWPMEVRGRSGRSFAEVSGGDDELRAYLGVSIPDFPNLFSIQGPNSSIGHGGGATWVIDCQSHYIASCLTAMSEQGIAVMECRAEVCDDYNRRIDEGLKTMVWSHEGVQSRYRNSAGRIVANHPWTLLEFWSMTREPVLLDFELEFR